MEFKSQIATTPQQSKRLLELGLKKETADMCWQTTTLNGEPITYPSQDVWMNGSIINNNHFPAWSLHRLIEMSHYYDLYFCMDSPYDGVIDHIEYLIENNEFNSEYLEEKQYQ